MYRVTKECYKDRCFRMHLKGTRCMQTPPVTQEPKTTPQTTNQQQAKSDLHSPPNIPPPLTLPPHQLITTPHLLSNISPPITLSFHCIPISHHPMPYIIKPAHHQLILNSYIRLKHLHSHPKHTILLFSVSSSHLNPTPHTLQYPGWVPANDHNIFFMGSDAQCTTIEQHDGGNESNCSFLRQTNLYSIISCNIQGLNTKEQKHRVYTTDI